METTKSILDFLVSVWEWIVIVIGGFIMRFLLSRAVKSYTDEIGEMKADIKALKEADLLPRKDADKVVAEVRKEHEKMFQEQTKQHAEQREDFKHIENRIDATNARITEIYQILVDKLH